MSNWMMESIYENPFACARLGLIKDRELPDFMELLNRFPRFAFLYARSFLKGRWEEAEPYIMEDPEYAYQYARFVLNRRWLEAEERIFKSDVNRAYRKCFHI